MKKLISSAAISVLLGTSALAGTFEDQFNKQVNETSFVVNNNCSGTLISPNLVLTANHCINDDFKDVEKEVVGDNGEIKKKTIRVAVPGVVSQKFFSETAKEEMTVSYNYRIKNRSSMLDLALLKTDREIKRDVYAKIACEPVKRLDEIYAVGNPFVVLYATVTKGIVSSTERNYQQLEISNGSENFGQDNSFFQFTAPIAPGNSGGAVYNTSGELVGVVVRGGVVGTIGFGVPLNDVRKFLKDSDAFSAGNVEKVCE